MNTASRILFENQHCVACITRAGLSVQSKRSGNGKAIRPDSADFPVWMNAIETAMDAGEANMLCRAIFQS